jgi:hypothetical protein
MFYGYHLIIAYTSGRLSLPTYLAAVSLTFIGFNGEAEVMPFTCLLQNTAAMQ